MTQVEKLVAQLTARPVSAAVGDVRRVLDAYGWEFKRQSGSHLSFRRPGDPRVLTIATQNGRTVKRVYIEKVCEVLGLDEQ